MMRKGFVIAGMLVVVAGCGSGGGSGSYTPPGPPKTLAAAKLDPGQEATIFPLVKDNRWSYDQSSIGTGARGTQQATDSFVWTVSKVTTDADGTVHAVIDKSKNDVVTDRLEWQIKKDGLYQVASGLNLEKKLNPPQPNLQFPVVVGKEFTWTGTMEGGSSVTITSKTLESQVVDTGQGKVSAIPVESKYTHALSVTSNGTKKTVMDSVQTTAFWAPKIGLVRLVEIHNYDTGASAIARVSLARATLK